MADLIYFQDQYKKDLEAKIVEIQGNKVLLDKTILFPDTSTEPGDLGKINGLDIIKSEKMNGNIWHVFNQPPSFTVGDTVKIDLDWTRRLTVMKIHSALHLLGGVYENAFGKRAVAGAVKGNQGYLVFKEELSQDIINQGIEKANNDIKVGLEIKSYWDEKRPGFRWTQVGTYPPIPDGGLLVKNTNEIGTIGLSTAEYKQGKQKVTIILS